MKYILSGDPIALKRPRFRKNSGVYDPQKSEKERSQFELKMQHGARKFISGPLELIITFFMKIPESKKRTVKPYLYHPIKPALSSTAVPKSSSFTPEISCTSLAKSSDN